MVEQKYLDVTLYYIVCIILISDQKTIRIRVCPVKVGTILYVCGSHFKQWP